MKARSPIEILIDRACGVPEHFEPEREPLLTLSCPGCRAAKRVHEHETDPPGTTRIEYPCPKCLTGDVAAPRYYAANGQEIAPATREGRP